MRSSCEFSLQDLNAHCLSYNLVPSFFGKDCLQSSAAKVYNQIKLGSWPESQGL